MCTSPIKTESWSISQHFIGRTIHMLMSICNNFTSWWRSHCTTAVAALFSWGLESWTFCKRKAVQTQEAGIFWQGRVKRHSTGTQLANRAPRRCSQSCQHAWLCPSGSSWTSSKDQRLRVELATICTTVTLAITKSCLIFHCNLWHWAYALGTVVRERLEALREFYSVRGSISPE